MSAIQVQMRRGTAAQHAFFTGAAGEITVVTDDSSLRVHDGSTAGGHTVAGSTATFTSGASGLVPASGGGTTNFLRADGSWAAVVGGVSSVAGRTGAVTLSASDVSGLATVATSGSYNDLSNKPTLTPAAIGAVASTAVGATSGVASLDSSGKVPTSQLPAAIVGALSYQGTWNASTNSPSLASGTGTKGYMYKVSTPGTTTLDGNSSWSVGDFAIYDGTTWDRVAGSSEQVSTVFGRVGAVVATSGDYSVSQITGAAPLASPAFTGTPTAPTVTTSDNSTSIATTAWVKGQGYAASALPLSGGTMTGSVKLYAQTETTVNNTTISGTYSIPCNTGTVFTLTMTGNTTFSFGTVPTGAYSCTLVIKQDSTGSRIVTWPTMKWAGATPAVLSTAANAVDIISMFTPDSGTTWYATLAGKAFA